MGLEAADLCQFCSDLVRTPMDTPSSPLDTPFHATYGALSSSSKACALCHIIICQWKNVGSSLSSHGVSSEAIRSCQDEFPVEIEMKAARRMDSGVSWTFWTATLSSTMTYFSIVKHFTLMTCSSGDPGSTLATWKGRSTTFEENLTTIQSWMHDCCSLDGHEKCRPVPFAPLRLLTVGLDGGPIKLVERNGETAQMKYATLSYCWGGLRQLYTTKENLPKFCKEIPLNLIPKTFTDAIHIARALGIPHIWIDALCIVQNDEEEWQREAAQMSNIYQGSQLTISAAQSMDSSQGCFHLDELSLQNRESIFRTRLNCSDGSSRLVQVYCKDIRDSAMENCAISTRGWTLQEQLLSSRLVFCMQPEIHWQCQANYQTQSGLSFKPMDMSVSRDMIIPYRTLQLDDKWYRIAWQRIIEVYSWREFTYSQDRVPAMAGITQLFASILDDVSILGLWRKSFARDLAWLRMGGRPQMSDISGLPSWTWLACQGSVLYTVGIHADPEAQVLETLELLDLALQWQGTPYTSPVKFAQVLVRGPVQEIRIEIFAVGNLHKPPYFQVFGEESMPTTETKIPWRCAGQFDDGGASGAENYLCLLLFSETKSTWARVTEYFLILQPVDSSTGVRYKRVGSARIWGESPSFNPSKTMSMILI